LTIYNIGYFSKIISLIEILSQILQITEPVPKLIDYALKRATFGCMVLGQALAVFQAFSLRTFGSTKLRNLRKLSQKLKFWESP
jgi:hypothetical protein